MKHHPYCAGLLLLCPFLAQAQAQAESFVLKGTVGVSAHVTRAYLRYGLPGGAVSDSAAVHDGHFEFRGTLPEPVEAGLMLSHDGTAQHQTRDFTRQPFYLERGTVRWATPDSAAKAVVRGTPLNDEAAQLRAVLRPLAEQAESLSRQEGAAAEARQAALEAKLQQLRGQYVQAHPGTRLSLFVLQELGFSEPKPDLRRYAGWYQGLSAGLRTSPLGQRLGQRIERLQRVAVGATAPDFTQNTPDNVPVTLSSLRGKYVLLDFWASWCAPCRQENPNVLKAYNAFKDKGFTVISVSLDSEKSRAAWLRAIQQDGLTWMQVSDLKSWSNAAAQEYGVESVPQNFLLDPQGRIVAANLRGEALQRALSELLR